MIGNEKGFERTQSDEVKAKTIALRLQVKRFMINTKLKEGLITAEQGLEELKKYQES